MGKTYYTLSNLLGYLRIAVQNTFPESYWVCAEISKVTSNASGHWYLDLVERDQNGGAGAPKAQIKGTIWKNRAGAINGNFQRVTGKVLENGMKILSQVQVSYSEVYGLSLNILDIDPTYTLGDIARQREETIAKLHEMGVWDRNRSLPEPEVPQNIAVISSATAAGYQDFMNEIERSAFDIKITLFEAMMQGQNAEASILSALKEVQKKADCFQITVITRGGGSTTDLGCFDSFELSKAVALFELPVLTGIGHERDQSIVDMVAGIRTKTPTAAAQWIIGKCSEMLQRIETASMALQKNVHQCQTTLKMQIKNISLKLASSSQMLFQKAKAQTAERRILLGHGVENILRTQKQAIDELRRMLCLRTRNTLATVQTQLRTKQALVDTYSPEHVFRLGYALAKKQGKAIRSVGEVKKGEKLTISLSDGEIDSKILDIRENGRQNIDIQGCHSRN